MNYIDKDGLMLLANKYTIDLLQSFQMPRSYIYGMKVYKGR